MSDELRELIALAGQHEMTPAQREAQRRSFAYGNTHFENSDITAGDRGQGRRGARWHRPWTAGLTSGGLEADRTAAIS